MIKSNQNHHSKRCPQLIQIPKPLQHKKKSKESANRIKSIGYGQNLYSIQANRKVLDQSSKSIAEGRTGIKKFIKNILNRGDIELIRCDDQNIFDSFNFTLFCNNRINKEEIQRDQTRLYVKTQPVEVPQPTGDTQTPALSNSQTRQAQNFIYKSYYSSSKSIQRRQMLSTDRIMKKSKPKFVTQEINDHIVLQNQILREQNQKLKQLSHQRKNHIEVLIREILELKYQISNLIMQSQSIEHFRIIQKSLNKEYDLQYSGDQSKIKSLKKQKQTRQAIAKDIFKKLKQVSYIQDSFLAEQIN